MIKNFLLASTTLALTSTALMAADLPSRRAPPAYAPPVPVFSWTGFYVGANVGFGGDRYRYPFALGTPAAGVALAGEASVTSSGVIGGGQIGYNFAPGSLPFLGGSFLGNSVLFGVEADFDGADIAGRASLNGGAPGVGAVGLSAGSRTQWLGTVRGRIGYTFDRLLVYATGGFAYSRVYSSLYATVPGLIGGSAAASQTHTGYTVGGGFEYAITNNVSLKTEYLYTQLNTKQLQAGTLAGLTYAIAERPSANIVRAGINYKFDMFGVAPAPVVAKY